MGYADIMSTFMGWTCWSKKVMRLVFLFSFFIFQVSNTDSKSAD